jgi:hypothetical protein
MGNLDDRIAFATRRVLNGRRIVEKQKKLAAERRADPAAVQLLKTFEKSLAMFEEDLERLLAEQDAK